MTQHGIEVPVAHRQLQLNAGIASLSASEGEVFDLNIRITDTKKRRRQIQVSKPSFNDQHDPPTGLKQASPSQYCTLHLVVICQSLTNA